MENNEYKKLYGQKVGIVTMGRLTNSDYYNHGNSLILEGILDNETDTQIFLKDLSTTQNSNEQLGIKSLYGAISKDKIISLYLIGNFKVKKVQKTEKSELIEELEQQPKPA